MPRIVDLRSDTVTRPVPGMRQAIAEAEVGDDVFGDDPTVNRLEERIANLFGREAALFVPSGSMANTVCLASLTRPGDEVIIERGGHVFNFEVAAVAGLFGVQMNALDGDRGVITAEQIEPYIRGDNIHNPVSRVIAIENTHNNAGGRVFPIEEIRNIRELADANGLFVHLDGARLANAHVKTGIDFKEYASLADTVTMCFSKGLGAPVGSVAVGDADVIKMARKKRKQLGGGMRQAGILAAAALYALDQHVERLAEDHAHASRLGEALAAIDGIEILYDIETNIIRFRVDPEFATVPDFLEKLRDRGVMAGGYAGNTVRFVTNLDVSADDVDYVVAELANLPDRLARS